MSDRLIDTRAVKLDRSAFKRTTFAQAEQDDLVYWLGKTSAERLAGIES